MTSIAGTIRFHGMKSNNPVGRPTEFQGDWLDMVIAAGSVADLAKMMQISLRTLQRWARREDPVSLDAERLVNDTADTLGVQSPYHNRRTHAAPSTTRIRHAV